MEKPHKAERHNMNRSSIRKKLVTTNNKNNHFIRLSVYKSNSAIYAMLIDDSIGKVLTSISSKKISEKYSPVEKALEVGKSIAQLAKKSKITDVVFDRNGYKYHGQVKSLADGARQEGLNF